MTTHTYTATFTVRGPNRDQLEAAIHHLMDELLGLEEAGCGIHSSAVSADLENSVVTIEVSVDEDLATGEAVANSCVRAAIHATGGATPDWELPAAQVSTEALLTA